MKKLIEWWTRKKADKATGRIIHRRMTSAENGFLGPEFETLSMSTPYLDMIRRMVTLQFAAPAAALRLAHAIDAFDQQPHVLTAEVAFEKVIARTRQRASRGEHGDVESASRARTFCDLERARYLPESRTFLLQMVLNETQLHTAAAARSSCDNDELRRIVHAFVDAAAKWEA